MMPARPPLIDAAAVAARLGVSRQRAYELMRLGVVPVVRIGRQVRVCPVALERWIASGGQALPGGWRARADEQDGPGEAASRPVAPDGACAEMDASR